MRYNIVSLSGGKDSTATAILCRELENQETIRYVFADTGNEHPLTIEYVTQYLPTALGIRVDVLRRNFEHEWWRKREYITERWRMPHKHWPSGVPEEAIERALRVFDAGPTGVPYLDLCIIKGRFPTRRQQFCTWELKTVPMTEYALQFVDAGAVVWSWQGIRAEEGGRRRYAPEFEELGGGLCIYRPILRWSAQDCFDAMRCVGVKPNPLYLCGATRVGCMPCINVAKSELAEIARRFPEHIDRIAEWERIVSMASKRGWSSFFPAPEDGRADLCGRNVREYVAWARTDRGGRQFRLLEDDPSACSSSYGLCESVS